MKTKLPKLLEWQQPPIVNQHKSRKQLKGAWLKVTLTTILTTTIAALAYWALKEMNVDDPKLFGNLLVFLPLFTLFVMLVACVVQPIMLRSIKTTFYLTEKGIHRTSSQSRPTFCPWKKIASYSVEDATELPNLKILQFTYDLGINKHKLYFSDETLLRQALNIFDAHIETNPTKEQYNFNFTKKEIAFIITWFIFSTIAFLYYFNDIKNFGIIGKLFPLLMIILGPGTWAILALRGPSPLKAKSGRAFAILLNLLWMLCLMIIGTIYAFCTLYRQLN